MPPTETQFTREELYRLVWAEPTRTVAQRLGISDVALVKHCKKMKLPVPGRGYWAKRAAGHKMKSQPLPTLPPHDTKTPRVTTIQPQHLTIEAPPTPAPVAEQM